MSSLLSVHNYVDAPDYRYSVQMFEDSTSIPDIFAVFSACLNNPLYMSVSCPSSEFSFGYLNHSVEPQIMQC